MECTGWSRGTARGNEAKGREREMAVVRKVGVRGD